MIVTATKYSLSPERICAGTRGSYGMEKLEFAFSEDWNNRTIKAVFYPVRGKPVEIPYLGGEIDIPQEVMQYSGEAEYVLSGVRMDGGELDSQIITLRGYIDVMNTLSARGGNAKKVTPDLYDQFLAEAGAKIGGMVDDALEKAKESGEFKGEPGDPFEYKDFTPEQLESLRGRPGDPGVFVKESASDEPDDTDTVMVDLTPEEEEEILIPDSLLREGDKVWLMCEDEKLGDPFVIKDGKDGADGKNFRILGYYGTLELLRASVPNPEVGEAYGVGTAAPYNVYVYDGVALDWIDNGSLAGVAGADGVGIKSIEQTTVSSEDGGTNVIAITLTDNVKYTFEVKNGRAGTDGKSANLTIGTVTTGEAGGVASASITGTAPNFKLNLVIPKGENGEDGEDGSDASIKIDSAMSDTSSNAVENKVIKAYIDGSIGDVDAAIAEIETILGGA